MSFFNFLRGPHNQSLDSGRILFFVGGLNTIFAPICFETWAMHRGQAWDITAFCLAYGGMLALVILPGCAGIAIKDNGVAKANQTCPNPGEGGGT